MWNYSFVVPNILVMLTLLCFYFGRPRIAIRINQTFLQLLVIQALVIFFDVVSSLADEHHSEFSTGMLYLLNTGFFVCFLARSYWFFRMTLDVLRADSRVRPAFVHLAALPFVVVALVSASSFLTGAFFTIDAEGYHSGPAYGLLYLCFVVYLVLSLVLLAAHAKELHRADAVGVAAYNVVLAIGITARYLFPRVLIMNTFCTVAILIIFLSFLNPDLYLSGRGSSFNMRALHVALTEATRHGSVSVLGFSLQNYNNERAMVGGRRMDVCVLEIVSWLRAEVPHAECFYLRGGRLALLSSSDDWGDVWGKVVARFERPWDTGNGELYLGAGIAYAGSVGDVRDVDLFVNNLVIALENARDGNPLGEASTQEEIRQVDEQLLAYRTLERALEGDGVEVFLQPLVDGRTHRLIAAEALARIYDEQGKLLMPDIFIPLAEKSGLIGRLGEQVLRKVCAFISAHDMDELGLSWINVNLSPLQCLQQDLYEQFMRVLGEYGVSPSRIHLEITEQSMIDYSLLKRQITALNDGGFVMVLDDYGTGYSNLTRVKSYPFANVKLDMELVWGYFDERDELLPTVVRAFGQMGMSITAEGIESAQMADALTSIGVDYLQGFYFSRPIAADEFAARYQGAGVLANK